MAMKPEKTNAGSFPKFPVSKGLKAKANKRWQVLAGDRNHWRVGYYSPTDSNADQVTFLEKHTCVELFLLLKGAITVIVDDGKGEKMIKLEPMKPVMVSGWHNGFSPKGKNSSIALVVERDDFNTIYRER